MKPRYKLGHTPGDISIAAQAKMLEGRSDEPARAKGLARDHRCFERAKLKNQQRKFHRNETRLRDE